MTETIVKTWEGWFCTRCQEIIRTHDVLFADKCSCKGKDEDEWPYYEIHYDDFPPYWVKARFRLEVHL